MTSFIVKQLETLDKMKGGLLFLCLLLSSSVLVGWEAKGKQVVKNTAAQVVSDTVHHYRKLDSIKLHEHFRKLDSAGAKRHSFIAELLVEALDTAIVNKVKRKIAARKEITK